MTIPIATVLAASLLGAITDVRARRIPHWLVGALAIVGLVENAIFGGGLAVLSDAGITAAVLLLGTLAFGLSLIAGGDVKLLAAAAGTLAYPAGIWFILFTLLCGGIIGIAYATARGRLQTTIRNISFMTLPLFAGAAPARPASGLPMPYALAIFSGALCTALLGAFSTHFRFLQ